MNENKSKGILHMEEELKEQIIYMIVDYEKTHPGVYINFKITDYPELAEKVSELLTQTNIQIKHIQIARMGMADINGNGRFPAVNITFTHNIGKE